MNKTIAQLIFVLIDLAAIYMAYRTIKNFFELSDNIKNHVSEINFQWPLGLYLLLLVVPILHLSSFVKLEFIEKSGLKEYFTFIPLIIIVAIIVYFNMSISSKLNNHNYKYDTEKSKRMTFSTFRVYQHKN